MNSILKDRGTYLVVAAHPDDEVLGCGGTMARLAAAGESVHVAILGEGVSARAASRKDADRSQIEALRRQSREAAALLGVKEVHSFDLPDNRFDTVPLLDVVKIVEGLIEKVRPAVVLAQHGGDLNVDHQAVFRACLTATRPAPGCVVETLLAYEVASSTEWAFQRVEPVFRPCVFVDIGTTLDLKIKALNAYQGEVRDYPHPRSGDALRAAAQRWGSVAGVAAAEAFELIRDVSRSGR